MHPERKRRMLQVAAILSGVGLAAALALSALGDNLNHFYSPSDIHDGKAPQRSFRLGGVVLEGSTQRVPGTLEVRFVVTDRFQQTPVRFSGILPDLFREGQSVIGLGQLAEDGVFVASEVLAKHDETYMPREVEDAVQRAKQRAAATRASTR